MAQTSTTLATSSGHKANITGTDISFNEVSGVYKITSTSTALSNIDALDVITVTGTTNNNKTFTVKSRQSANELRVEEIVVDENSDGSTTTTIDYTGFVTDKAKGDGYYSQGDGTHTVAFYVDASLNDDANIKLCMQGSLATTPTESDWFDISGTTIDQNNIDGSTLVFSNNFTGNFVWVRAKVSGMSAGSVTKILYNN
jgi:hypothetical protein|tara:strand:- start:3603 stop:4199 length:597 start_codon:yes stop_codon:yes gene_type:complete